MTFAQLLEEAHGWVRQLEHQTGRVVPASVVESAAVRADFARMARGNQAAKERLASELNEWAEMTVVPQPR